MQTRYPAMYLAQIQRPGDPLIARTAGEVAYMSGTTNLGFADRVLSAWGSPTLTESAALRARDDEPWYIPDFIGEAKREAFDWLGDTAVTGVGLIVGAVLVVLALYLLAKD